MITQTMLEQTLLYQHIKKDLKQQIQTSQDNILNQAVEIITAWINQGAEYESKQTRLNILKQLDLYNIVLELITNITYHARDWLPLVSVLTLQTIDQMDSIQSATTLGEIIGLLQGLELYHLDRDERIYITRGLLPSKDIEHRINHQCYLPPMIVKPRHLTRNHHSAYITLSKDNQILSDKENYHEYNISLDVLNTLNQNQYKIDTRFLKQWKKQRPIPILTKEQQETLTDQEKLQYQINQTTFDTYKEQFDVLVSMLKDRTLYLTNKVDKRGRIYAQGYHFNTQGSSFEKATLNLKKREHILDCTL